VTPAVDTTAEVAYTTTAAVATVLAVELLCSVVVQSEYT
jgi:hypothetical protein